MNNQGEAADSNQVKSGILASKDVRSVELLNVGHINWAPTLCDVCFAGLDPSMRQTGARNKLGCELRRMADFGRAVVYVSDMNLKLELKTELAT